MPSGGGLDGEFVDVEPQIVEAADAGVDAPAFTEFEGLLLGEFGPEVPVAVHDPFAGGQRIHAVLDQAALGKVHQLPGNVHAGDLQVIFALAAGQLRIELAGFSVHQIRGEGSGIAPEQRVGQRHVAPVEPGQMQPDQQQRLGVNQAGEGDLAQGLGEDGPVWQREAQVLGHQDRAAAPRRPRRGGR